MWITWVHKSLPLWIIRDHQKVKQPIPGTCYVCQKINYIKMRKKRRCFIKCRKRPSRSVMHEFTLFPMSDATCVTETVYQKRYCRFVLHRRIGKVCVHNKKLLHCEKTSFHLTVERKLKVRREQVTTWCDLRGLLYSHSDLTCLLIQRKCIQPSVNILAWVAWLFDHSVQFVMCISGSNVVAWGCRLSW
jgi:hypothetical protein